MTEVPAKDVVNSGEGRGPRRGPRLWAYTLSLLVPSLAMVLAVTIAASTWERVKTTPQRQTLRVSGSATQRIISDLIEWNAEIEVRDADRVTGYRTLSGHVETTLAYLKKEGVKDEDMRVSSATTNELLQTEYVGAGEERVERTTSLGWSTRQTISVRSADIARVERVSREVTRLLEQGVPVASQPALYHYTKLGELKVDMLSRAAEDAHLRAEKIVHAAGGDKLGKLWGADMGIININPANSSETSWEGNNDKTSFEKDIIAIVHLTFELP